MPINSEDINSFHKFALSFSSADADMTLEELVAQWRLSKDRDEVNDVIRKGLNEIAAGEGRPENEVFAELKEKFDLNVDS